MSARNETGSRPKRPKMNRDDGEVKSQNRGDETCAIDRLDDFSLLQVFNRLDIGDLCNTADVNHQFKRVSKMSFSGRYSTFDCPENMRNSIKLTAALCKAKIRRVLCKFGDLIKSMKWTNTGSLDIELDAISKYCAGTMDELDLVTVSKLECKDCAWPLFSSIKSLSIECSGFTGKARRLFAECQQLKILRLRRASYSVFEVVQRYHNLEELRIGEIFSLNAEITISLLQMNRQIKKLDVFGGDANKTIYAIVSKMDHLEELVLRQHHGTKSRNHNNVTKLAGLKSLKVLELHSVARNIDTPYFVVTDFVAAIEAIENVQLVRFKWFNCPPHLQFIKRITKLKTLNSLALTGIYLPFDDCLAELGEQLPLLHELELEFEHQHKPLLSLDCLIKFVERSTNLDVLVIRTIHSDLMNQQFCDALLAVIQGRRSGSSSKTLKVTIYCRHATALRMPQVRSNLLQVKFLESRECSCGQCSVFDRRLKSSF